MANIPNPIPIINTDDVDADNIDNDEQEEPDNMCNDDVNADTNEFRLSNQPQTLEPYVTNGTPWKPKNKISNFIFCLGSTGLFLAFGGAIMTVTGNVEPVLHPMLAYLGPPALVIGVVMVLSSCMYWMWGLCTRWRKEIPLGVNMTTETAATTPGVTPTGALETKGQCEILIPTLYTSDPGTSENIECPLDVKLEKGGHNSSTQSLPTRDCEIHRYLCTLITFGTIFVTRTGSVPCVRARGSSDATTTFIRLAQGTVGAILTRFGSPHPGLFETFNFTR